MSEYFLADECTKINARSMYVDGVDCSKAHIYHINQYSVYCLLCTEFKCIINLTS